MHLAQGVQSRGEYDQDSGCGRPSAGRGPIGSIKGQGKLGGSRQSEGQGEEGEGVGACVETEKKEQRVKGVECEENIGGKCMGGATGCRRKETRR